MHRLLLEDVNVNDSQTGIVGYVYMGWFDQGFRPRAEPSVPAGWISVNSEGGNF